MAKKVYIPVLFPVGRYVGGSVEKGRHVEIKGVKQFHADGSPVLDYSFGFAIPKTPGKDWKDETWGAQILAKAQQEFPQGQWQHASFSWKIQDGDSTIPNKKNKKNSDNPNYANSWVVWFSSRFPVKTVNAKGTAAIDASSIRPGFWIQVLASVAGNDGETPGMYLNHDFVSFQAPGEEITFQQDASEVGFGNAPLPAGVSSTPVGQMAPPPANPPAPIPTVPHSAPLDAPPPPGPRYALGSTTQAIAAGSVEAVLAWPGWTADLAVQHGHLARV